MEITDLKNKAYSTVGKPIPNIDGIYRATGSAKYAVDIALPNMLWGKILRSPHAHARIVNIDTSKARKVNGVRAIITAADTPKRKYGGLPVFPETVDEYGLALDKVRYIGDEIAAVAAIDEETAQEAIRLIKVEYEILPAVFDPVEAMMDKAPQIHNAPRNIAFEGEMEFGNVEKGFQESDCVREDEFTTSMLSHCALEPHASAASVSPSGKITVWSSTQSPYFVQRDLSQLLDVPIDRIRVIKTYVGGAFGGKVEALAPEFCCSLLALKTQKPVKITYSREEEFISTRHRHPTIIRLKTGVKNDGTIVAKDCQAVMDGGAYNSFGPGIFGRIGGQISLVYRVPNMRFKGYLVYTNKPVCGAMRGVTNFQARFADDSQMDMIARDLGLDPIDIRLKNARQPGETTPHGWKVTSCGLTECIKKIYQIKSSIRKPDVNPYKKLGIGVSCWGYYSGARVGHGVSGVFLKVNENGTAQLLTGAADIGQGLTTVLCQIAAEELGVSLDKVQMSPVDTDSAPIDLGSWLSRTTYFTGNAVIEAAKDAKRQIFEVACEMLDTNMGDLICKDNVIYDSTNPEKSIPIEDAVRTSIFKQGKAVLGKGYFDVDLGASNPKTGVGNASPAYAFGAVLAEVEVNVRTGQVAVRQIASATDCGYPINPLTASGQIEGAIVMGIGGALFEELKVKDGHVLNPSFMDYKVPRATDAPEQETYLIETLDPGGPFGAKGISEGAAIPVAPAIANAICDALGKRFTSLPITPEQIVKALRNDD
jgi:4-hydroxybenzoyl-CoA reductase alpha subunit